MVRANCSRVRPMREFLGQSATSGRMQTARAPLEATCVDFARVVIITRVRVRYPEPDPGLSLAATPELGGNIESASVAVNGIWEMLAITSCPCTWGMRPRGARARESTRSITIRRIRCGTSTKLAVGNSSAEPQLGRCVPVGPGAAMTRGITHAAGRSRCRLRTAALTGRTKTIRHGPCSVRSLATRHCGHARVRQRCAVPRHMIQNRR